MTTPNTPASTPQRCPSVSGQGQNLRCALDEGHDGNHAAIGPHVRGVGGYESRNPASPPVQMCPDCQRPFAETAHQQAHGDWCMYQHSDGCARRTITSLRQDLATLQAKHDAMVGERWHLEAAARLLRVCASESPQNAHEWPSLGAWLKADELAARAKGGV